MGVCDLVVEPRVFCFGRRCGGLGAKGMVELRESVFQVPPFLSDAIHMLPCRTERRVMHILFMARTISATGARRRESQSARIAALIISNRLQSPSSSSAGFPMAAIAGAAGGAVLLALLAFLYVRRRRSLRFVVALRFPFLLLILYHDMYEAKLHTHAISRSSL